MENVYTFYLNVTHCSFKTVVMTHPEHVVQPQHGPLQPGNRVDKPLQFDTNQTLLNTPVTFFPAGKTSCLLLNVP